MVKFSRPSGPVVEQEGAGANLPLGAEPPARPLTGAFRRPLFLVAAFALTACATTSEPQVRTVEVKVPVAVNCTSNIPPPSSYPDTDAALRGAANIGERVKLMLAGKKVRDAEILELRASVSGCR